MVAFIIAAVFTLISTGAAPSFALLQGSTSGGTSSRRFLAYCSSFQLPEAVILPNTIDIEPSNTDTKESNSSAQLYPRHVGTPPCTYVSVLFINATILDAVDSNCSFTLKLGGTFRMLNGDNGLELKPGAYCLLGAKETELSLSLTEDIDSQLLSSSLLDCPGILWLDPPAHEEKSGTDGTLILTWAFICAGIETGIIFVYLVLWMNQSCYGWSIIAMVGSLLCYNVALASFVLIDRAFNSCGMTESIYNGFCVATMATVQFGCMCSYSWTLVLAFHMWTALRSLSTQSESQGLRQFLKYSVMGYGLPFGITGIFFAVISAMANPDESSSCKFYAERLRKYRYWNFYIPNGTIFLLSMIFLLLTLKWARETEKNRKSLRSVSRLRRRRTSLRLSLNRNTRINCKLMVVMGAFFGLQILTFVLDESGVKGSIYVAWFIFVSNVLHSVCLFWTFVWNKAIRGQLATRFPGLFGSGKDEGGTEVGPASSLAGYATIRLAEC